MIIGTAGCIGFAKAIQRAGRLRPDTASSTSGFAARALKPTRLRIVRTKACSWLDATKRFPQEYACQKRHPRYLARPDD